MGRREAGAKGNGKKWKERMERRVEKIKGKELVRKLILGKVRKWVGNVEREKK